MTNAEKFVDLIADLYPVGDKQATQMQHNTEEIEAELGKYNWEDIRNKVQYFYSRKNDKSRPRIGQILAMLESDPNVQVKEPDVVLEPKYKIPTTKIWSIRTTFDKLVQVLIDGGVLPNADGEYHNIRSLVNPDTDDVILNPLQWLKWKLTDAMQERPDLFVKFPNATVLEGLAIAVQGGLVKFKVRDWAKLANKGE